MEPVAASIGWDRRFLGLCEHVASWSKDPSTKVGAVIVRPDRTIASVGYNGFPRGVRDEPNRLSDRETKYALTVHAEMNAILSAAESVQGYTLYTTPCLSCDRCAVHVIQAGIRRCVAPEPTPDMLSRWRDALRRTRALFAEANVVFQEIPRRE